MKKYLLFLLGLACYAPAIAQQWRIAPTVGVNLSTISFSNAYLNSLTSSNIQFSSSFVPRWQVGVLIDYTVSERISIRSGLLYSTRGSNAQYSLTQSGYTATANGNFYINYLDMPLLVKVAVGENGLRLVGGPVLGIALNGTSKTGTIKVANYTYDGVESKLSVGNHYTDGILPTDLSISLGLLKQFDMNGRFFELGFHVQPSLSSFDPGTQRNASYSATHFQFGLKASYFFELSR